MDLAQRLAAETTRSLRKLIQWATEANTATAEPDVEQAPDLEPEAYFTDDSDDY